MIILLGRGIVFLLQMLPVAHKAPAAFQYTRDYFRSCIQTLMPLPPQILLPVSFEVGPSWNSLLLSFQTRL